MRDADALSSECGFEIGSLGSGGTWIEKEEKSGKGGVVGVAFGAGGVEGCLVWRIKGGVLAKNPWPDRNDPIVMQELKRYDKMPYQHYLDNGKAAKRLAASGRSGN